jgi:hypothetical protein
VSCVSPLFLYLHFAFDFRCGQLITQCLHVLTCPQDLVAINVWRASKSRNHLLETYLMPCSVLDLRSCLTFILGRYDFLFTNLQKFPDLHFCNLHLFHPAGSVMWALRLGVNPECVHWIETWQPSYLNFSVPCFLRSSSISLSFLFLL